MYLFVVFSLMQDKEEEEEDQVSCHSIEPPTPNTVNWEEYISAKPGK